MTRWIWRWWRRPERFDWLAAYLRDHRLLGAARASMVAITATFAVVAGAMLWSSAGPVGYWARMGGGAAATTGAALAVLWCIRWPSRGQSRLYVVLATASIAGACLAQGDPLAGLTGSYAFVVMAGYVALMHGAKSVLCHFVVSMAVASALLWRVIDGGGDAILAACEYVVFVLLSLGAPVALQAMLHVMSDDILRSDRDALTGLLNRRGFYRQVSRLLDDEARASRDQLVVTMIDLDDFKSINDNHGHASGDRALVDVGDALRQQVTATGVVARAGGEEFLIAEVSPHTEMAAQRLCVAVAGTPHGVTASIGTCSVPLARLGGQDRLALIDTLIACADDAMYAAKSGGGNRHCHAQRPPL